MVCSLPSRARSATVLCTVLCSALALRAEDAGSARPCKAPPPVANLDNEPPARCEALLGGLDERALARRWREAWVDVIEGDGPALDIIHGVAGFERPTVMKPASLMLSGLRRAPAARPGCEAEGDEGEWLAVLELDEEFARLCPGETAVLRRDDALGSEGHVLHVGPRGVLALHNDKLVWLPAPGIEPPAFRMTWRSSFIVQMESGGGGGSSSASSAKTKPKKASKSRASRAKRPKKQR